MLAGESEPLKLADGRLVYPGGKVVDPNNNPQARFVEVPTNREATKLVVQTRRKLADLPDVPRTMNAVSVILSYSLFGLDDEEIALAIGVTTEQVGNIKMSEAYETMYRSIVDTILETDAENVRDIFKQHARKAAHVMVDALDNGARGDRILAAKDFLDRAGHRPADIVEHRHKMEGGMTIEIVRKDDTKSPITIDMEI